MVGWVLLAPFFTKIVSNDFQLTDSKEFSREIANIKDLKGKLRNWNYNRRRNAERKNDVGVIRRMKEKWEQREWMRTLMKELQHRIRAKKNRKIFWLTVDTFAKRKIRANHKCKWQKHSFAVAFVTAEHELWVRVIHFSRENEFFVNIFLRWTRSSLLALQTQINRPFN